MPTMQNILDWTRANWMWVAAAAAAFIALAVIF
jgi:uncharacterized protein involved in exopolysaccharide biosynthesis